MTIERRSGNVVFVCDTCEDELETNTDDWSDALAIAKREDWKFEKVGRDWIHGCPRCGT